MGETGNRKALVLPGNKLPVGTNASPNEIAAYA